MHTRGSKQLASAMKVEYLVADSGAFIRNADLYQLGDNIYTCADVISEIRDKATKQRLSALPFQINYKDPNPAAIQKIIEASKKTGDYGSLSHTDIKVLALTYELTCTHDGKDKVKEDVEVKSKIEMGRKPIKETQLLGFYLPQKAKTDGNEEGVKELETEEITNQFENVTIEADFNENSLSTETTDVGLASMDNTDHEELSDEDDGEGWITPGLLKEMNDSEPVDLIPETSKVACLTTDFAMQNVLLQMNLQVLSVDGMQIKTARSYVLRCHACFCITKKMDKTFCPKCGNKTLKRVPVEIQEDGTMKLFFSRNPKVLNPRGLRYSLPKPQGGKHSNNPILCEDQRLPHDRPSRKALLKTNVWSDDYDCNSSPFATNEVNSRAFRLGVKGGQRQSRGHKNPNAVGRKFVKRK